jgi:formate hydrogenlyase subunit 5
VRGASAAVHLAPDELAETVGGLVEGGRRLAGLVATADDDGSTLLRVLVAGPGSIEVFEAELPPGTSRYRALTPSVPAAAWYEREIHDLFGIEPVGHPRLDPLVLPLAGADPAYPRPGASAEPARLVLDVSPLPAHVMGEGLFTIPYGPVRSGVFESVEYLVESYGEDIPHVRTRVYYKHRGIERRFDSVPLRDGVLLAERVEGTASVAHAVAFCQALESLAGIEVPPAAALVRVIHAELERIAAHLDSVIRHTEGAGQAVAYARMSVHKERLMRLRAQLCGHRFGRGVVVPGGVSGPMHLGPEAAIAATERLESAISDDSRALMETPSFLDRLRRTGVLPPEVAAGYGALGPVGRGSGVMNDVRADRPYGGYRHLGVDTAEPRGAGDALSRQRVRVDEVSGSFSLIRQALDELSGSAANPTWQVELPATDGLGIGWVEAPQGELLYLVETSRGKLRRVKPRTASFHNLALFPQVFRGDILTDFVFIEASFGLSVAGVAG